MKVLPNTDGNATERSGLTFSVTRTFSNSQWRPNCLETSRQMPLGDELQVSNLILHSGMEENESYSLKDDILSSVHTAMKKNG
ncbi:hypothetical protein STEG23_022347 [Scotinomys teguina]